MRLKFLTDSMTLKEPHSLPKSVTAIDSPSKFLQVNSRSVVLIRDLEIDLVKVICNTIFHTSKNFFIVTIKQKAFKGLCRKICVNIALESVFICT